MNLTPEKAKELMDNNHGSLDLRGTGITSLPDNLTVGGYLDLRGTSITSLPDNLAVGGSLYLEGTGITSHNVKKLKNGDYVKNRYLYCDDELTHVKRVKHIGAYAYYVGKIKNRNVVSDGEHFAHCKDLESGIRDLEFKKAKDRGSDQYRGLTRESVMDVPELMTMYRIITGACEQGTQNFVDSLGALKESYAISEILAMTKGKYGHGTFVKFFEE